MTKLATITPNACLIDLTSVRLWGAIACIARKSPPDGRVSQRFPPTRSLWAARFSDSQRSSADKGVSQPGIHYLSMSAHCLSYLLCLIPCLCLLCVSPQYESHSRRHEIAAFFKIIIIIIIVTLYSRTTPFCSSSGGGCQETMMAVPLSPLSVTVTSRGGALGTERSRQKTHLNI